MLNANPKKPKIAKNPNEQIPEEERALADLIAANGVPPIFKKMFHVSVVMAMLNDGLMVGEIFRMMNLLFTRFFQIAGYDPAELTPKIQASHDRILKAISDATKELEEAKQHANSGQKLPPQ